jgi:hypothetical protein
MKWSRLMLLLRGDGVKVAAEGEGEEELTMSFGTNVHVIV